MIDTSNGGILEPKSKIPMKGQVEVQAGVARDALAVAIQIGDILIHMDPAGAEEVAQGILMACRTVRALQAQHEHRIVLPTT